MTQAESVSRNLGVGTICHVELPRSGEAHLQADDEAVSSRATDALNAAVGSPDTLLYIDTFEDKDRGYFPRVGLIDRRSNPRAAIAALRRRMFELT